MTTYEPGLGDALADKIRIERTARGWSYGALSRELGRVQCKIAASSLHRIERGTPRRTISAEELFAFAEVFDLDVARLAQPASEHFRARAATLLERHALNAEAMVDLRKTDAATTTEILEACTHLSDDALETVVEDWIDHATAVRGSFEDDESIASALVAFLRQSTGASTPFRDAVNGATLQVPGYRYWSDATHTDETGVRIPRDPSACDK
ncbi:helix-turn-helix domain-containing protein [Demequina sp.]|uniref:helix-turn-helix domain-containing protein n=1 Tax=Demequina sp. TaxID=2050685 RepID=UPI003A89FCC8